MTTIQNQIIDLQHKMDLLQKKQKEEEYRKKNTIDALYADYELHNNNIKTFISHLSNHSNNRVFKHIDSLTQKRFDILFKIITIQNNKINELEKLIDYKKAN